MQDEKLSPASSYSSFTLAYKITRYLLLRAIVGCGRGVLWLLTRALMALDSLLGLVASPLSSGRDEREFQDLIPTDAAEKDALRAGNSNAFWSFYYQAYMPRLWRMRRMLPMSVGRNPRHPKAGGDED